MAFMYFMLLWIVSGANRPLELQPRSLLAGCGSQRKRLRDVATMANDTHFRKLERMYLGAPINQWYRPTLSISEGSAEVSIAVRPEFFHAANAVHGSVYFKLLDDSAFFAANSLVEDVFA